MKRKKCPHCKSENYIRDFCNQCGAFIYDPHNPDWDENEVADWWKKGEVNRGRWQSEMNQPSDE